ncbi:FecR domain-containing protein [Caballeronia mineralivorans]|jgi:transmembrane sensor|uniref:FecR family protein n=1 Tax=Caballeronia mineralivorans TaxID=2010198 RepID=UPI0023F404A9|nr:FecR domain-containing protein [Caballeronia mineralivorans]MDB5782046.1 histidine kinase [Caballeronia mineralivorans]
MDSTRIECEAADWLARRDSGAWSEADARAFAEWQSESTAHRIAVIRIEATWQRADRLQALGAGAPRGQIPAPGSWRLSPFFDWGQGAVAPVSYGAEGVATSDMPAPPLPAKTRATGIRSPRAWAAMLVLALGGASVAYFLAYDPDTYRSDIGAIKVMSLADGSTVTLNTNTVVHVRLTGTSRRIDLERGEAFFEVAKDPGRPFVVNAAGERVIAVGTQFSVFRRTADTRVVVTQGKVKVEEFQGGTAVGPATELPAGSIAQVGSAGVLVKQGSLAEAEAYTSWRSGYITLNDTELATAVAEFNRYNKKQLLIGDPSIATLRVGGSLRAANVEAFVRVLEEGFPVRAQDQGDQIVLTGTGSQH